MFTESTKLDSNHVYCVPETYTKPICSRFYSCLNKVGIYDYSTSLKKFKTISVFFLKKSGYSCTAHIDLVMFKHDTSQPFMSDCISLHYKISFEVSIILQYIYIISSL